MKLLSLQSLLCPFVFGLFVTAQAQVMYLDDNFNYTDGPLGSPWVVSTSGSSTATVGAAQTLNDYTPTGKEVVLVRPTTGDGVVSASITTGANAGTSAWDITTNDQVQLSLDFNLTTLNSGNAFSFFLRGESVTIFGIRVRGNGADPQIQTMSTSSTSSFAYVSNTPNLDMDTWYHLDVNLEVTSNSSTISSITLEQLGTGGGVIYDESGFVLNTLSPIGGTSTFLMGTSSGTPNFSTANVQLTAIPEASSILFVAGSSLMGLMLLRHRRRKSAR